MLRAPSPGAGPRGNADEVERLEAESRQLCQIPPAGKVTKLRDSTKNFDCDLPELGPAAGAGAKDTQGRGKGRFVRFRVFGHFLDHC
jgi:hypothetical protein